MKIEKGTRQYNWLANPNEWDGCHIDIEEKAGDRWSGTATIHHDERDAAGDITAEHTITVKASGRFYVNNGGIEPLAERFDWDTLELETS